MSKYIIEIKPEYEDKFKGVMILGAENSNLYVDSNTVDELEELTADYINENFGDLQDEAYQKGFEDGKKEAESSETIEQAKADAFNEGMLFKEEKMHDAFLRGVEKGKAVHEKGCEGCKWAGMTGQPPCIQCSNNYPNVWQKQDDKIEVGDEVKHKEYKKRFVVTKMQNGYIYGISEDGSWNNFRNDGGFDKTGRHFDIASILEDMKHD